MTVVYLNGRYVKDSEASISIYDRGFLFGDGVYEVIPFYNGVSLGLEGHLARLREGLSEIRLSLLATNADLVDIMKKLQQENSNNDTAMYLQITRGADTIRNHLPTKPLEPTLLIMPLPKKKRAAAPRLTAITREDLRWKQCNIKAITLLSNVVSYIEAAEQGIDEVILLRDDIVTEGVSSNVFIIKNKKIMTPVKNNLILAGVTRNLILQFAKENNLQLEELDLTAQELKDADEIWLTSSTKEVQPVVKLDGIQVGSGEPGPVWHAMYDYYQAYKQQLQN